MTTRPTDVIIPQEDTMVLVSCTPGRPMNLLGYLPDHSLAGTPTNEILFTFTSCNRDNDEERYHQKVFGPPTRLSYHGQLEFIILGEHQARVLSISATETSWTEQYEVSLTKKKLQQCLKQIFQTCAVMRYDASDHQTIQQPNTFSVANVPFKPKAKLTVLAFANFDDLKPRTEDNVTNFHTLLNTFSELLHYQSNLLLLLIDPINRSCQLQLKELVKAINQAEEGPLYEHRRRILYLPTGHALRRTRFVPGTPQLLFDSKTLTSEGATLLSEVTIRSLNRHLNKLEDLSEQQEIQRPGGLVQQLEIPTLHPNW